MSQTIYLSDKEEKLVKNALKDRHIAEKDGNNPEKAKEYGDLWDKIA